MSDAPVPSPAFDPDSAEPQPPGSLAALIGRLLTEIEELQFESFSKDDALDLGLRLVELGRQRSNRAAASRVRPRRPGSPMRVRAQKAGAVA